MKTIIQFPFFIKFPFVLISVVLLVYVGVIGESIIVPFFLAILVASLLFPASRFLEKKLHFSRYLSAIIVTLLFLIIIFGILFFIGTQLSNLSQEWPAFRQQLTEGFKSSQQWIHETFGVHENKQLNYITENAYKSLSAGTIFIEGTISSISSMLMISTFVIIYTVFLLIYRNHLIKFLLVFFDHKYKKTVLNIISETQIMVKKFLTGLFIQMLLMSIMTFIAYSIIGVKYSFMLAIITGILNVLPYLGISIALLIAVLISFATAGTSQILFILLAMAIVHSIDANIVMPKIIGSKAKLNSLVVVLGLVIGYMIWGILGMLLTIPILATLKIIFDRVDGMRSWGFLLGAGDNHGSMFNFSVSDMLRGKHKFPDKDDVN